MAEDGLNNSAILLMSLGEEEAAEVLKLLSPKEVQKLGEAMAKLKKVPREKVESVLEVFEADAADRSDLGVDTDAYLRNVLNKALGPEKAGFILDRILQGGDAGGIEGLKWMDPVAVGELLKNEHPQVIASVLVHLERDHASAIMGQFADAQRSDVLLRIATLDGVQPNAMRELNEVLARVMAGSEHRRKPGLGGVRAAAEILKFMGGASDAVLESVREYDAELAQSITDEMFVFDGLIELDDKGIQLVLREVQSESLVVALKGASEELREKILSNMSQRAAETLRDDLESKGPVRISEVEGQQKEILKIVRRLADEGQLQIGGKGGDEFV